LFNSQQAQVTVGVKANDFDRHQLAARKANFNHFHTSDHMGIGDDEVGGDNDPTSNDKGRATLSLNVHNGPVTDLLRLNVDGRNRGRLLGVDHNVRSATRQHNHNEG